MKQKNRVVQDHQSNLSGISCYSQPIIAVEIKNLNKYQVKPFTKFQAFAYLLFSDFTAFQKKKILVTLVEYIETTLVHFLYYYFIFGISDLDLYHYNNFQSACQTIVKLTKTYC